MHNRENDCPATVRELYWDEDNRHMVLSDNGKTSRYTYNHSSERVIKSHGFYLLANDVIKPYG